MTQEVTEFNLTVNLDLLNTLRFALGQVIPAAQRADQALQAAINAAVEAAKGEPVSAEPAPAPMAKTNGKHASV
jgi:AMMECR1 domain-containing protein